MADRARCRRRIADLAWRLLDVRFCEYRVLVVRPLVADCGELGVFAVAGPERTVREGSRASQALARSGPLRPPRTAFGGHSKPLGLLRYDAQFRNFVMLLQPPVSVALRSFMDQKSEGPHRMKKGLYEPVRGTEFW